MAAQKRGQTTRRTGRLPQRVYWFRRTIVLVVAAALVFGFGKLLGGLGSNQSPDQASTVASSESASGSPSAGSATQGPVGPAAPSTLAGSASGVPLVAPTGACAADEVSVAPSVPVAQAGRQIVILLRLQGTQPACTFAVSPDALAVKVTSGADRIWSSQDCPNAIPRTSVVVRSGVPAEVPITWSGRRSDSGCSNAATWAMPGYYHVVAAALGSAPTDVQFAVTYPKRGTVTKTAKPKPKSSASASATPKTSTSTTPATPSKAPTPSPSASANGKGSACGGDNAAGSC